MVHYIKKDTKLKPFCIASVVLCVLAVVLAVGISGSTTNYQIEKSTVVNLSSGNDISLRGEAMYNDTIYLTKDITISNPDATIGSSRYPFEGVFDGQGHTVHLTYGAADSDTSLFNYIAPGAIVRNVTFVFDSVRVQGTSYGGIAKINDGTIENCKVVFENLEITSEGLFSPLVVVNRGAINGVVVNGTVSGSVSSDTEDKILYGNVCVYNKGTIDAAIADAEYTGFLSTDMTGYQEGTSHNVGISALRYNDLEGGETKNAVAIIGDRQITSDYFDESVEFGTPAEVYSYTKIFDGLGYDFRHWEVGDDDLLLVIEEGVR